MNAETEELEARAKASEAYHEHPSNPSSCQAYEQHNGSPCPCENGWRLHTGHRVGGVMLGGDAPSSFEPEDGNL